MTEVIFSPREPPLRYRAEKRRDHGICRKFRGPASSQLYISGGGSREKKITSVILQLLPLATFEPRLVQVGQCAWELGLTNNWK